MLYTVDGSSCILTSHVAYTVIDSPFLYIYCILAFAAIECSTWQQLTCSLTDDDHMSGLRWAVYSNTVFMDRLCEHNGDNDRSTVADGTRGRQCWRWSSRCGDAGATERFAL